MLQHCYDELAPLKLKSLPVLYIAYKVEMLWKSIASSQLLSLGQ